MLMIDFRSEGHGFRRRHQIEKHFLQVGKAEADGVKFTERFHRVVRERHRLFVEDKHLEKKG